MLASGGYLMYQPISDSASIKSMIMTGKPNEDQMWLKYKYTSFIFKHWAFALLLNFPKGLCMSQQNETDQWLTLGFPNENQTLSV